MDFDYVTESEKLKKKLFTLIVVMAAFTVMGLLMSMGFGSSLLIGIAGGLLFYIPGRLKSILKFGWIGAIILSIIYYVLFFYLSDKLGNFATVIFILIPLADIGYSIYKVVSAKKNG